MDKRSSPRTALQVIRDEHRSVAAVLHSLTRMLRCGPGDQPERFFDVVRAMLFYIDEFPERLHHPKESDLLFPKVVHADPALMPVVHQLEMDHLDGQAKVRELQHLLLGWELLGEARRAEFEAACGQYAEFYSRHMHLEETQILPAAERLLSAAQWDELDRAFQGNDDPVATGQHDPRYERLFTRIVMRTPAPLGLGPD